MLLLCMMSCCILWLVVSYLILPDWWKSRESRHPALLAPQRLTVNASGIPGDPVNLMVVGSKAELISAMVGGGWNPADPVTLKSSIGIVESAVFHRPYPDAPVSDLLLFGRREDLAFEKQAGKDARTRHHVRFWEAPQKDASDRPAWWGAVTFDRGVGFSHTTGQVTHHIAPEIDAERDGLSEDLSRVGMVARSYLEGGYQEKEGRNAGGDAWKSDGGLRVIELGEP